MAKATAKKVKTPASPRIPVRSKPVGGGNPSPNKSGLTQFKPGEGGRPKGTKNKMGVRLKECILEAAELSGSNGKGKGGATGYLVWLSRAEPAVFGRMLEKIMPTQVDVKDKTDRSLSPQEAVERLKDRGLPIPSSLLELTAKEVGLAVAVQDIAEREAEVDDGMYDSSSGHEFDDAADADDEQDSEANNDEGE